MCNIKDHAISNSDKSISYLTKDLIPLTIFTEYFATKETEKIFVQKKPTLPLTGGVRCWLRFKHNLVAEQATSLFTKVNIGIETF